MLGFHAHPLMPSLALDADGGWLNVNADTAASAVAGALEGDHDGVVGTAEAARVLTHAVVIAEMPEIAECDVGKKGALSRSHPADDGAH